jgi:hypothetical protein
MPIQYYYIRTAVFSCLLGGIIYYIYNIVQIPSLVTITTILLICIYFTLAIELPFFKSLLVSITGVFLSVLVELFAYFLVIWTTVALAEELHLNKWHTGINLLTAAILIGILTFVLQKFKIGFMIVPVHFLNKQYLRPYNFILSGISVLFVITIIFLNAHSGQLLFRIIMAVFFSACSIVLIWYLYLHNKRSIEKRYAQYDKLLEDTK